MEDLDQEHRTKSRTVKRRALDLSVVQVAASALAAVVGAILASELGVYGTIAGAAVVSIGATTGGAVLQHVFRRTGEEIRSRVPAAAPGASRTEQEELAGRRADAEAAFDPFHPGGEQTRMMAVAELSKDESVGTYRGGSRIRPKSWKSYALIAGLVFALAMGTVTVVEVFAGKPLAAVVRNEPGDGTSWGGSAGGSTPTPRQTPPTVPPTNPSGMPSGGPSGSTSPTPSVTPSTTPSHSAEPSTTPSATPSTSGTGAGSTASGTPSP
ncbi:hypothetical protein [Streptacidiphilus sp. PAMC 29251]